MSCALSVLAARVALSTLLAAVVFLGAVGDMMVLLFLATIAVTAALLIITFGVHA